MWPLLTWGPGLKLSEVPRTVRTWTSVCIGQVLCDQLNHWSFLRLPKESDTYALPTHPDWKYQAVLACKISRYHVWKHVSWKHVNWKVRLVMSNLNKIRHFDRSLWFFGLKNFVWNNCTKCLNWIHYEKYFWNLTGWNFIARDYCPEQTGWSV